MRPLLLILCPVLVLLPACGHVHNINNKARAAAREKELKKLNAAATSEADDRLGEKAAGEVVRVDATGEFVLIRARNGVNLVPDQELVCKGPGGGRIKVTPERGTGSARSVFAADVMSGVPAVGDIVTVVKNSKAGPKLVPLAVQPGSQGDPANTLYLNPNEIRPEHLPNSTLGGPRDQVMPPMENSTLLNEPTHSDDGRGNLLVEPPLPDKGARLLPEPDLPQ